MSCHGPDRARRRSPVVVGRHALSLQIMVLSKLRQSLSAKCDKRLVFRGRPPVRKCRAAAARAIGETDASASLELDVALRMARELLWCKRRSIAQRPTIMNAFSPELAEHWRASQASHADDRSSGSRLGRFAVAGPTGSLGGTGRARQRRAQRLLIPSRTRIRRGGIIARAHGPAGRDAPDTRSPLPAIFLPAGFFLRVVLATSSRPRLRPPERAAALRPRSAP